MPVGTYRVMDGTGEAVGTEEFRAAAAPAGWRYFSSIQTEVPDPHREVVDLTVDRAWQPLRLRIHTGAHELLVAARDGGGMTGIRDGRPIELEAGEQTHLDYLSPCFNAVTAARLTGTAEIDVVYLEAVTCEPVQERQRYELEGEDEVETPVGRFRAARWRYTALRTGWSRPLWVTDGIVVAYEGLFELVAYEPGQTGPFPLG